MLRGISRGGPERCGVRAGPRSNLSRGAAHFDNVVFAGGGNRCFWQAGFWSVVSAALDLAPSGAAAVSAGSAIACALFAGTFDQGFAGHKRAVAMNQRKLYLRNLLRRKPVFRHGDMYRNAILGSIDDGALMRLHQGPDIRVPMS